MSMGKRFTDVNKWRRPWFCNLDMKYKILWSYILDNCDMSGVWYVDLKTAGFLIGAEFEPSETFDALQKQIEPINGGARWLIKDFVRYQYGEFSKKSPVHKCVEKCAMEQGLSSPWPTLAPTLAPTQAPTQAPTLKAKAKAKAKATAKAKAKATA